MHFVNYSNHPSVRWSDAQKQAAEAYGAVIDVSFREVPPEADEAEISAIADEELEEPFGLQDNDLPLDSIVRLVERETLSSLGKALPEAIQARKGYLT